MTGVGERIMVLLSSKQLADLVASGRSTQDAAAVVLHRIATVGGFAGLIALDSRGRSVATQNTAFMAFAERR
jgi:isoaspartyl peptidase/L-asparaginase-like protein (Ntn-hydrolase superfamily)